MTAEELFSTKIQPASADIYEQARKKWDAVAKPLDGLGDFEEMICRIAAIHRSVSPDLSKKALLIMCADNGVVRENVSQTGQQVTYDVASLMGRRKSSVGIMAENYPLDINVYDVGINSSAAPQGVIDQKIRRGTADFLLGPAMEEAECLDAIRVGMDAANACRAKQTGIIATGEMGIGNTTTSTAVLCAVLGMSPKECTGKGSGLTDAGLQRKIDVITEGLKLHLSGRPKNAFEILQCLGGLDIAALTGVYIGGALYRIPVVVDGLISAVAALVAEQIVPGCKDYMIASHLGRERGMELILQKLGLKPVIHANMALGEGTGAVMLFPLLDMAISLYENGTAFKTASIEQYERFAK